MKIILLKLYEIATADIGYDKMELSNTQTIFISVLLMV